MVGEEWEVWEWGMGKGGNIFFGSGGEVIVGASVHYSVQYVTIRK